MDLSKDYNNQSSKKNSNNIQIYKVVSKCCDHNNSFQQALLDMFYMDNIFEVTKHSIVLYFLQDIIDFTAAQHVTQVKKF